MDFLRKVTTMRPITRTLLAGPLALAVLTLVATSPARAGSAKGIVVSGGTVQPVPDPFGGYTFDVNFNPVAGETIQVGDSFSVTSTVPMNPFSGGSNSQPLGWLASFSDPVTSDTVFPEYYKVTWQLLGAPPKGGPIAVGGSLDPGPLLFAVSSPDSVSAQFTYSFSDHIAGQTGPNTGGGAFTIYVPEPASLVMVSFSAVAGLFLARGVSQRRHAIA